MDHSNTLGTASSITCPDCGGVLVEYYDGDLLRFRCQVGHAFSPESLVAQQTDDLDTQLWAAYRALDERASLARRLAQNAHRFNDQIGERRFMQRCEVAEQKQRQLLQLLAEEESKNVPDVRQLPEA